MTGLDLIGVKVEGLDGDANDAHNAMPVLHEIRHALRRLVDTGENTIIDLSAIPFGPGDRDRLLEALGQGEVSAVVDALGQSLVEETAYPGVWVVRHRSPLGDEIATHIEITRQPSLLLTPEEDIGESAARLAAALDTDSTAISHNT